MIEGKAAGYKSSLDRNPDLAALVRGDALDKIFKPEAGPAQGDVKLSATVSPADPSFSMTFAPASVSLTEISSDTFTITTTAASGAGPHTIAVRGVDAAGKSNALSSHRSPSSIATRSSTSSTARRRAARRRSSIR